MNNSPKYYLVEASALPEIFLKVAEAKRLLATGEASTVNDAAAAVGISRSAFYKYRDTVQPFRNMNSSETMTFQFLLHDEPGVLSAILTILANHKANLLTVNSIIPTNGCALVTISVETSEALSSVDELMCLFYATNGVLKADILAAG